MTEYALTPLTAGVKASNQVCVPGARHSDHSAVKVEAHDCQSSTVIRQEVSPVCRLECCNLSITTRGSYLRPIIARVQKHPRIEGGTTMKTTSSLTCIAFITLSR